MAHYKIEIENNNTLKIGFAEPAQNDAIVRDAAARLSELEPELIGGELIKVNGPASLPVAMVIAHALGHKYAAVACFDPKLGKYVVAIAHGGRYQVGDLVD